MMHNAFGKEAANAATSGTKAAILVGSLIASITSGSVWWSYLIWFILAFAFGWCLFEHGYALGCNNKSPFGVRTPDAVDPNTVSSSRKMDNNDSAPYLSEYEIGESGDRASFTYVDADGVITDRVIINWVSEGQYIRGLCLERHAARTFRKDRIDFWLSS